MRKLNQFYSVVSDAKLICTLLCTGILYSLFLWPLLNSILCVTLGAYWLLFCKKSIHPGTTRFRLVVIFASLYLPYVTGMIYTANTHEGIFRLQEHIAFVLFPIVFGFSRFLDKDTVRLLLTHFIISCLITAGAGYIFGLLPADIHLPTALLYGHQYIFGNTYPYIIAMSCLLSLVIICENGYDRRILRKGFIVFIFVFLSYYLLFLNVRLASICWLATMIYYICRNISSPFIRSLFIGGIVLIMIAGMYRVPAMKSKWEEFRNYREQMIPLDKDASLGKSWGGMSIRVALWRSGKDLILRHPLLGVGTGDVQDSLQQAYENRKFYFASRYNRYNLHNQYLQMLAAFGIYGLVILLMVMVVPVVCLRSGPFYRMRLIFLLLFFLICFTEVILDTNKGIIWYSFFNSIFAFGAGEADV